MQDFDITKIGNAYENLEITRCEDFGPGTKLLGSFDKIFKYDYVIKDYIKKLQLKSIIFITLKSSPILPII